MPVRAPPPVPVRRESSGSVRQAMRADAKQLFLTTVVLTAISLIGVVFGCMSMMSSEPALIQSMPWMVSTATGQDGTQIDLHTGVKSVIQTLNFPPTKLQQSWFGYSDEGCADDNSFCLVDLINKVKVDKAAPVTKSIAWEDIDCPDRDYCQGCDEASEPTATAATTGLISMLASLAATYYRANGPDSSSKRNQGIVTSVVSCCMLIYSLLKFAQECATGSLDQFGTNPIQFTSRYGSAWYMLALGAANQMLVATAHYISPVLEAVTTNPDLVHALIPASISSSNNNNNNNNNNSNNNQPVARATPVTTHKFSTTPTTAAATAAAAATRGPGRTALIIPGLHAARKTNPNLTQMNAAGLYFGTLTGNTETIANYLGSATGLEPMDVTDLTAEEVAELDGLIIGAPTWNTGADVNRSGTGWDEWLYNIMPQVDMSGKTVAIFGCGDQESYMDNYCDATGEVFDKVTEAGATVVGFTSTDGYNHLDSKGIRDGKFVGLMCDEDTQYDLSEDRANQWVAQLKQEGFPFE